IRMLVRETTEGLPASMTYRKLRIAWSVAWGVVAVLLVVLWVRSYGDGDALPTPPNILCVSSQGTVLVMTSAARPDSGDVSSWSHEGPRFVVAKPSAIQPAETKCGLYVHVWSRSFWIVQVAYWLLAFPLALLVVVPSIRQLGWRFSLRTLLIA